MCDIIDFKKPMHRSPWYPPPRISIRNTYPFFFPSTIEIHMIKNEHQYEQLFRSESVVLSLVNRIRL